MVRDLCLKRRKQNTHNTIHYQESISSRNQNMKEVVTTFKDNLLSLPE